MAELLVNVDELIPHQMHPPLNLSIFLIQTCYMHALIKHVPGLEVPSLPSPSCGAVAP